VHSLKLALLSTPPAKVEDRHTTELEAAIAVFSMSAELAVPTQVVCGATVELLVVHVLVLILHAMKPLLAMTGVIHRPAIVQLACNKPAVVGAVHSSNVWIQGIPSVYLDTPAPHAITHTAILVSTIQIASGVQIRKRAYPGDLPAFLATLVRVTAKDMVIVVTATTSLAAVGVTMQVNV
jgi:hypothetical protein